MKLKPCEWPERLPLQCFTRQTRILEISHFLDLSGCTEYNVIFRIYLHRLNWFVLLNWAIIIVCSYCLPKRYFNWIREKLSWWASIHRPPCCEEVKAWCRWLWLHGILAAELPLELIVATCDGACDSTRRAAACFRSIPEAADWWNRVRLRRTMWAGQEVAHRKRHGESSLISK